MLSLKIIIQGMSSSMLATTIKAGQILPWAAAAVAAVCGRAARRRAGLPVKQRLRRYRIMHFPRGRWGTTERMTLAPLLVRRWLCGCCANVWWNLPDTPPDRYTVHTAASSLKISDCAVGVDNFGMYVGWSFYLKGFYYRNLSDYLNLLH